MLPRFLLLLLALLVPVAAQAAVITGYRSTFLPCRVDGHPYVATRSFVDDGTPSYLLVDPWSFRTRVVPASSATPAPAEAVNATPFMRELARVASLRPRLANFGLTHAEGDVDGFFLTVDLCPSSRGYERELFGLLERRGVEKKKPVPVAIAVTGLWMERHAAELEAIRLGIRRGFLDVVWVNHSYTHPYFPGIPLERNFLLAPGNDFDAEVLRTEAALLERDLVPSVFFRFPGLISSDRLTGRLRELCLIPIGSDAWLAKGEAPTVGSVILVHGNGNEPQGIRRLLPMLGGRRPLRLLPLFEIFRSVSDPKASA